MKYGAARDTSAKRWPSGKLRSSSKSPEATFHGSRKKLWRSSGSGLRKDNMLLYCYTHRPIIGKYWNLISDRAVETLSGVATDYFLRFYPFLRGDYWLVLSEGDYPFFRGKPKLFLSVLFSSVERHKTVLSVCFFHVQSSRHRCQTSWSSRMRLRPRCSTLDSWEYPGPFSCGIRFPRGSLCCSEYTMLRPL